MAKPVPPIDLVGTDASRVLLDINDDSKFAVWDVRNAETGSVQMVGVTGSLGSVVATLRRSNSPNRNDFVALDSPASLDATNTMSDPIDLSAVNYLGVFITTASGGAAEADFVPCFKESNG